MEIPLIRDRLTRELRPIAPSQAPTQSINNTKNKSLPDKSTKINKRQKISRHNKTVRGCFLKPNLQITNKRERVNIAPKTYVYILIVREGRERMKKEKYIKEKKRLKETKGESTGQEPRNVSMRNLIRKQQ